MAEHLIPGFSGGEVAPALYGRTDLALYPMSCKTLQNAFGLPAGPAVKRPGTMHLSKAEVVDLEVRLIPFKIDEDESIVVALENDRARIIYLDGTDEIEVTTGYPYSDATVAKVDYVQIGEVLYLVCEGIAPKTLTRTPGATDTWEFANMTFTVTAVTFPDFATSGNYPSLIEMYESRLILAATTNAPGTIWGSNVGLYTTFTISSPVVASDAWANTPQPAKKARILWLACEDAFCFGTEEGPWRVGGEENLLEATALAWFPRKQGGAGGFPVKPVIAENSVVYVQRGGRRLRSFAYNEAVSKWRSEDLNAAAQHIFENGGIKPGTSTIAYQQDPESIIWAVGSDGSLYSLLASDKFQSAGWSRHDLGGTVWSVVVVPTPDGEDKVVVAVDRGDYVSYEYLSPLYTTETVYTDDSVQLDAGAPVVIQSLTIKTTGDVGECTVGATSHGLTDGTLVRIVCEDRPGIEAEVYKVGDAATHTFVLYYRSGAAYADLSAFTSVTAAGTAIPVLNAFSGLPYADATELQVVVDGAYAGEATAASGAATSPVYGRIISIGRSYSAIIEPLEIPNFSRIKRVVRAFLRVYSSYGCEIGPSASKLDEVNFQTGVYFDETAPLVTDILKTPFPAGADYKGTLYMKSEVPMPLKVASVLFEYEVS